MKLEQIIRDLFYTIFPIHFIDFEELEDWEPKNKEEITDVKP